MISSTGVEPTIPCPYCSNGTIRIYHSGICPKIKSIEYHKDGSIAKVTFKD